MKRDKTKRRSNHIIPFGLGTAQAAMSYLLVGQLTYCLVDSYGMAATVVGSIFLLSRFFDGITDIIAGFIVDKTHTRFGKARPYDLMAIPLWILLILCFNLPNFNMVGKIIWIALTYNLCQSVCYTFVTISQTVRTKRSFEPDLRAKALSIAGLMSAVFSTAVSVSVPILITIFENRPGGWTIIISCFAVPSIIMALAEFFMVPEIEEEEACQERKHQKIGDSVKALFSNKYIFIAAVCIIMISMNTTVMSSAMNFYFKYVVGNLMALSLVGMMSLVGCVLIAVMPIMTKRFGNRNAMIISLGMVVLGSILKYVFKVNIPGLMLCTALTGTGTTLATCMRDLIVIDCMSYGQKISNSDYEGIYSSVKGFSDKMAMGIGSLLSGVVLDIGGFDSAKEVQTVESLNAIQFNFAGFPAIIAILGIVSMLFFNVEKELQKDAV